MFVVPERIITRGDRPPLSQNDGSGVVCSGTMAAERLVIPPDDPISDQGD